MRTFSTIRLARKKEKSEAAGIYGKCFDGGCGIIGIVDFPRKPKDSEYLSSSSGVWGNHLGWGVGTTGSSRNGPGVVGTSEINDGVIGGSKVYGRSGVWGNNTGRGYGVSGSSNAGIGIWGISKPTEGSIIDDSNDGIVGQTSNYGRSGVWGNNTGRGYGVSGSSTWVLG